MKKIMKRMFSLLLALVLVAGMVPVHAKAATKTINLSNGFKLTATDEYQGSATIIGVSLQVNKSNNVVVTINELWTHGNKSTNVILTFSDAFYCQNPYEATVEFTVRSKDTTTFTLKRDSSEHTMTTGTPIDGIEKHRGDCAVCLYTSIEQNCTYSAATCTTPSACTLCSRTIGDVDPDIHTWSNTWSHDDTNHWKVCIHNSEHTTTPAAHDAAGGTPATCDQKATCGTCSQGFGEKLSHSLNYTLVDGVTNVLRETCSNCSHELEAVLTADDSTYTGSAITSASIFYPEGWVGTQVQPDADDYADNVNAGTATVTTTVEGKELTTTFGIGQVDISSAAISFSPNDPTYTGNAFSPVVRVSYNGTELTEGTHYSVRWHDDNLIDANSYAVEIIGMGNFTGTKFDYFVIEKANPAVTAPTARDLTYNGTAQELLEKGSAEGGTMYYSLGTEEGPGGTSLESIPTGKDAGTYYVWYQALGDENHNNTNYERVEVTIRKAKPTISLPKANTLTYDGTAQELITAGSVAEGQGTMQYALISIGADGRPDVSDPVYSAEIPTAVDAGVYFVSTQVEGNENYTSVGYPLIVVTIDEAEAGSFPPPYNANDLTYNGTDHALAVVSGTIPYPGHFEFALSEDASEAPESGWSETIPTGKDAGTYIVWWRFVADKNYKDTEPAVFLKTIAPKSIESGEADIECPSLTWNGAEQDAALSKFTLDGLEVTYELSGNTALHVGLHDMTITGTGNFTGQRDFSFLIVPDGTILDGIEDANVTSDDSETLRKAKDMVDNADTENLTDEMKQTLTDIGTKADALRKRLNDAVDASATENVARGITITADNAKASDKETLQKAKADLEAALNTYGPNYTQEEQGILNDEIDRLEDLIADIAKSEETIKAIADLPATANPDNTAAWKKADEAQAAYDALTPEQKKIVDNSTGGKLPALLAGRYDVRLTNISTKTWYKKGTKDLVLTFNGPADKFDHLTFGGKKVDAKYVTVKSGSTVVTLKASYLVDKNITSGRTYKVSAVYNFGKGADGKDILAESATDTNGKAIEVVVKTAASSAATGDMFQVGLWAGIGGVSIIALIALLILMKKKK